MTEQSEKYDLIEEEATAGTTAGTTPEPPYERPDWFRGIFDRSLAPKLAKGVPPALSTVNPPVLNVAGNVGKAAAHTRNRTRATLTAKPKTNVAPMEEMPSIETADLGPAYELVPDAPGYLAALRGETFYVVPPTDTLYKFRPVSRFEVWVLWGPQRNKLSRVQRSDIRKVPVGDSGARSAKSTSARGRGYPVK